VDKKEEGPLLPSLHNNAPGSPPPTPTKAGRRPQSARKRSGAGGGGYSVADESRSERPIYV
jgi:hypothetical protein